MIGKRTFQSAGRISQHLIPGAYSRIDSVKGAAGLVSANKGVILGSCTGGKPTTLLGFSSIAEAVNTLRSGELMEALRLAFNPGDDLVPQTLYAMRVNTAIGGTLNLKTGANNMILLTSRDYGLWVNQIKAKVETGTTGKKVTINYQTNDEIFDNLFRQSIQLTHASATVTITNNSTTHEMVLSVGPITIPFATYRTIGDLVAYINQQTGYTAIAKAGQENADTYFLDGVTTQSLVGGYWCQSTMQAIIDAIVAGSNYLTAAANNGANNRSIPDNVVYTYLTGGTEGTYTATEWGLALTALESEDMQFIATPSTDTAVHASIKTHCETMSSVNNRKERQFLVGCLWGTTISTAITNALALNSKNGLLAFNGFKQYNINGVLSDFAASYIACMMLGMKCSLAINAPLTFKTLNVISLEDSLSTSELDSLIENGICPINYNSQGVPHVVRQVNSYQTDDLKWNEFSMVTEMYFISRDLRAYLESIFVGQPSVSLTGGVLRGAVEAKLAGYTDLGILIRDENGISWWNVQIVLAGDTVNIDFDAYLTAPINFIFITNHFHELVSSNL